MLPPPASKKLSDRNNQLFLTDESSSKRSDNKISAKTKIKQYIVSQVKKHYYLFSLLNKLRLYKLRAASKKHTTIINHGYGKLYTDIVGKDNTITIGKNSFLYDTKVRMRGDKNSLIIESDCSIGSKCSFWLEGNNIQILVKKHSTFTTLCHINAQEDGSMITIGEDCMLSNNVIIRTSDSHPIYNVQGKRINPAKDIVIGNHVWIAPNTKIMKGSDIGEGSIIGSDTTVTRSFPNNSLIVGRPAKVVKTEVHWTRQKLF